VCLNVKVVNELLALFPVNIVTQFFLVPRFVKMHVVLYIKPFRSRAVIAQSVRAGLQAGRLGF
jgi:hypothetical protein